MNVKSFCKLLGTTKTGRVIDLSSCFLPRKQYLKYIYAIIGICCGHVLTDARELTNNIVPNTGQVIQGTYGYK